MIAKERERVVKAGGFIENNRVNGTPSTVKNCGQNCGVCLEKIVVKIMTSAWGFSSFRFGLHRGGKGVTGIAPFAIFPLKNLC